MKAAIEISLYPTTPDYEAPIIAFIRSLQRPGIELAVSPLSTQLYGEYNLVMDALKEAMRPVLAGETTVSFVIKILNVDIEPGRRLTF